MSRRIAVSLAALVALVLTPSAAVAHADLASSTPEDGSQVRVMPDEVSLTLSEPVQEPAFVVVTSADGTRVNSQDVTVEGDTVTSAIDEPAPAGEYTMSYRIVSADAHAVTGSLTFEVLAGPAPASSAGSSATPSDEPSPASAAPLPEPAGSTATRDALIVLGFTVLVMIGLIALIRAGMRASDAEDD